MSPQGQTDGPSSQPGSSNNEPVSRDDAVTATNPQTPAVQSGSPDLLDLRNDGLVTERKGAADTAKGMSVGKEDGQNRATPEEPIDLMSSSIATLKPSTYLPPTTSPQYLGVDSQPYVDPTPPTPAASQPPSRASSSAAPRSRHGVGSSEPSPTRSDAAYDEKRYASEDEQESGSRSEIQSIMEQFSEEGGGPGAEEVMSPRLEMASPLLGTGLQHPPRKSSLEPLAPSIAQQLQDLRLSNSSPSSARTKDKEREDQAPPVPPKDDPAYPFAPGRSQESLQGISESPMSPTVSLHRPPPPEPEPEPALPFDFHRFLEQLRNKKADPVARYLKSFLSEFGKKQWMVHEQVKIIGDFLAFIANKMAQCEVWRDVSDPEFDNAREGMEKLVMNRLYSQTFSPAIPPPQPIPGAKPRRRGQERPMGPGRRGQHQEDVERDEILAQKINIYGWVKEDHLDIPPVSESGKRFLKLAQQG
jgi:Rab5 GDP/GTP exchange factor